MPTVSTPSYQLNLNINIGGADDPAESAFKKVQDLATQEEKTASADASADAPADAPANAPANTPPPANLQTLQGGNVTGDPPDNITLPEGTTATDITNGNGGRDGKLMNSLNDVKWKGTGLGDLAAQKYGFKDMKSLLADKSPEGAQAAAKILWGARASNHVTEEDGSARPQNEQDADTLSGYRKGDAFHGGTAAVFQDFIKDGKSINTNTTLSTNRTHADGEGRTAAQTVGLNICHALEKIYSVLCPPFKDLLKMTEDGAEKVRDKHVGDNDAAANDTKHIKQDGKDFGKDFGEFALNVIPGAGEVAGAVAKGVEVVVKVAKDVGAVARKGASGAREVAEESASGAKSGVDEAKNGASKAGEDSASESSDAVSKLRDGVKSRMDSVDDFADEVLDKLFGNDFLNKMTDLPKDATLEDKKQFVKDKINEQVQDVMQQYGIPQAQQGHSGSPAQTVSSQFEAELNSFQSGLEGILASVKPGLPSISNDPDETRQVAKAA